MKLKVILTIAFLSLFSYAFAQNYHGTTGLLHVPSAEMDSAGAFHGGVSFLHKAFLPNLSYFGDGVPFNTLCYTAGVTAFRWLELSYTGTILKMHPNGDKNRPKKYCNEDRHINVKVMPLYEGKWWPAIVLGWDDVGNFRAFKIGKAVTSNNYFENLYVAGTKHLDLKGYELGLHLAYRYYPSKINEGRSGLAGGVTFRPAFYRPLRFIGEWDGIGVNVGADVLLWRHLFIQAALVHGRGFMGGVSYRYQIKF